MALMQVISKEKKKSKSPLERFAQAMELAQIGASVAGKISDFADLAKLPGQQLNPQDYAKYRSVAFPKPTLGQYSDELGMWGKFKGIK